MKSKLITNRIVSKFITCPLSAWSELHETNLKPFDASVEHLLSEGSKVQKAAQAGLVGNKFFVKGNSLDVQQDQSMVVINDNRYDYIINSVISGLGITVKINVLKRLDDGFSIIQISSHAGVKNDDLLSLAIQVACAEDAGLSIKSVEIMHLDTQKVLSGFDVGNYFNLFNIVDVSESVFSLSTESKVLIQKLDSEMFGIKPQICAGSHCKKDCANYSACQNLVSIELDDVDHLPSHAGEVGKAIANGCKSILDLPASAMTNKRNALVYASILNGKTVITKEAREQITSLPYPRHFIDFEACAFALPKFIGMTPYEPIVFQWSCHTKEKLGATYQHKEFLDVSGSDPRENFIISLLECVGTEGSIMVFSSYEKTRLSSLSEQFPKYSVQLTNIIDRLIDVLSIVRNGFYSPEMVGSWSLKKIAPVLPRCADLVSYTDMDDVADGMGAQAAYVTLTDIFTSLADKISLEKKMLTYCASDTRGLAHLCESIEYFIGFNVLDDENFKFVKVKKLKSIK